MYPNGVYDIPIEVNAESGDPENGDDETYERPEADDIKSYDNLIGATLLLEPLKSPDNVATRAMVIRRKTDHLGNPFGKAHANPLLDTRECEVELEMEPMTPILRIPSQRIYTANAKQRAENLTQSET